MMVANLARLEYNRNLEPNEMSQFPSDVLEPKVEWRGIAGSLVQHGLNGCLAPHGRFPLGSYYLSIKSVEESP